VASGKVVAKFCSKYLHTQVLKNEAYSAGDLGASIQKSFFRYFIFQYQFFYFSPDYTWNNGMLFLLAAPNEQ